VKMPLFIASAFLTVSSTVAIFGAVCCPQCQHGLQAKIVIPGNPSRSGSVILKLTATLVAGRIASGSSSQQVSR
jgi:hypothetical protein